MDEFRNSRPAWRFPPFHKIQLHSPLKVWRAKRRAALSITSRALSHMLIAKVNCDVSGNGMEREGLSSVKKAKWVMDEKFASNQDARAVAEYDQLL